MGLDSRYTVKVEPIRFADTLNTGHKKNYVRKKKRKSRDALVGQRRLGEFGLDLLSVSCLLGAQVVGGCGRPEYKGRSEVEICIWET